MGGRSKKVARTAVLAVAGLTVVLASPGSAGAQREEQQQTNIGIAYLCGTQRVELRVSATFPATILVGEPVRPADVSLELNVPPEAMAELTSAGAVAATSTVKLETSIVQGETVASATWGAVQDEKVPLAADGPTTFGGPVKAEPITVGAAGDLSFTAVGLAATLTGWTADGVVTEPPTVELTCIPDPEAKTTLAVVPVVPADGPTTSVAEAPPEPGDIRVGSKEAAAPPVNALGAVPPECHPITPPNAPTWNNLCAKMAGYSNVNKLNASILQPTSLVNLAVGRFVQCVPPVRFRLCSKNNVLPELGPGAADDHRLAPAPGSFYSFGFVPTTGTMQLTQLDVGTADVWLQVNDATKGEAVVKLQVSAHLTKAKICVGAGEKPEGPWDCHGVPIDLGPNCRTATPIDVTLLGVATSYSITLGGILQGMIDIPPFEGCGVTEDLDPIITGLVSGPNNYVKMTQGPVCTIVSGDSCPPTAPMPKR
jgi:hypothetical protein